MKRSPIKQRLAPANIDNNGLISSSIEYENINDRWLSGVPDRDDEGGFKFWGLNWIRSGTYTDDNQYILFVVEIKKAPLVV